MVDAVSTTEHFPSRPLGQMEVTRKDVHPLPPVVPSSEARNRLENWGMPKIFIERLGTLTASFRYDLCVEKSQRIAQQGGYIMKHTQGEEVILPHFFDRKARGDGQCGDIAFQLLNALHFSGYLEDLNAYLSVSGKNRIFPFFGIGRSRTHFNAPGDNHAWLMLSEEGNLNPNHMVLVDPSFREISAMDRSGYHLEHSYLNPLSITNHLQAGRTDVGIIYEGNKDTSLHIGKTVVLGSSYDSQFVYSLGFLKNLQTNIIQPMISLIPPDANEDGGIATQTPDGKFWGKLHPTANSEHRGEIRDMLEVLKHMKLTRDDFRATNIRDYSLTIKFE